jgi:thiosulfate/3-mercaptopyruvate sulfurtransferase
MRRTLSLLIALPLLPLVSLLTACSGPKAASDTAGTQPAAAQAAAPTLVTSPESLLALLSTTPSAPAPILLDARPEADFSRARLPGARSAAAQAWDKLARGGNPLEDRAAWAARLGALGLDGSTPIIIYDAGGMTDAARVWFILQYAGAINVTILDGGLKVFQTLPGASALMQSTPPAPAPAPTTFVAHSGPTPGAGTMSKSRLLNLSRAHHQILDVRTPAEYTGADARSNARAGRVPGSVNIPHTALIAPSGRLRSPAELRTLFENAGLDPSKPIVTYCQSGGRASLAALAAIEAGFGPVSNYYNSFGEWAADMTCPVE